MSLGGTDLEGTIVRFRPDPTIFRSIELDPARVERRLQELAWLLPHLRVFLNDRRLYGRGGMVGWAQSLAGVREPTAAISVEGYVEDVWVEAGLVWTEHTTSRVVSYANTLETPDGGTHVEGLWKGLASYAASVGSQAHALVATRGVLEPGFTAAVHVKLLHPSFKNPRKDQLDSAVAARAVEEVVRSGLATRLPYNDAARACIHARLDVPRDAMSSARVIPADN